MRKIVASLSILFVLLIGLASVVWGQSDEYRLNVNRNFGYSAGKQIRGSFTIDVVPPTNIQSVTYQIDGQVMQKIASSPFSYSFQTSQYPTGMHDLNAVVVTKDGRNVTTATRQYEFATAEQESSSVVNILFPLLGGVFLVMLIGFGTQYFVFKNRPGRQLELGAPRNYGVSGGGVCPRCHRPYPLHFWSINAGLGTKFDRCDFCGKWAFVRRLSKADLETAERNEKQMAKPETPVAEKSEAERMKEMIDNSRYTS